MAKTDKLPEAERLYVEELMTFENIAQLEGMPSDRTLREWAKKGEWDVKRKALFSDRRSCTTRLYGFLGKLIDDVEKSLNAGEEAPTSKIYAIASLSKTLRLVREEEKEIAPQTKKKEEELPLEEIIAKTLEQFIGTRP